MPFTHITVPSMEREPITRAMLDALADILHNPSLHPKRKLVDGVELAINAFTACVARVGGAFEAVKNASGGGQLQFVVNDGQTFDQVIRLCFQTLAKCLYHLLEPVEKTKKKALKLKTKGKKRMIINIKQKKQSKKQLMRQPSRRTHFGKWHRHGPLAKRYLEAVNLFLLELHSSELVVPTIRAVADLVDVYICFPKLAKHLIKSLVRIWSQQRDEARCGAFVVLCKMARTDPAFFPLIYKGAYVAYIANCKCVDDGTLPAIGFMRRALVEFTFLHPSMAYQFVFVYVRQFAIHLRAAMLAKRRDIVASVYNWQLLKGLQLWVELVCEGTRRFPVTRMTTRMARNRTTGDEHGEEEEQGNWFRELAHPLVEIITIAAKLFPTPRFLPLRLHCLRMLIAMQNECAIYIPTLGLAVDFLDDLAQLDKSPPLKKDGTNRAGTLHVEKLLRLSREQQNSAGVRQLLAEELFVLAKDALGALEAGVKEVPPGWLAPVTSKLRHFLKTCANRGHVRLFTQLKTRLLHVESA